MWKSAVNVGRMNASFLLLIKLISQMFKCHFCKRVITSKHYYWDDLKHDENYKHYVDRNSICIECLRAKGY